ncbi:hypothetical protein B0H11DRAFT_1900377 [Mycena galericulata]|nr:hypothetical protein B0H11DRAFT_1900377 [Mycena galericulata]
MLPKREKKRPYWDNKQALLYPWGVVDRHCVGLLLIGPSKLTLGKTDALAAWFDPDPSKCDLCPKVHIKNPAESDASFTIFVACNHHPDPEYPLYPNKKLASMLPPGVKTCLGNVVVVKHPPSTDPTITNRDLPIVDIVDDDLAFVDEAVRRWVAHLSQKSQIAPSHAGTSSATPAMVHLDDEPSGWPCYDIDEILAAMTLEEQAGRGSRPASPATPPPLTPEPPATPVKREGRSLPATPARKTKPIASAADLASSPTIYRFASPTKSGYTADWSEAGMATQGFPSHVRAVRTRTKIRTKKNAYVVFRGRTIGVMHSWDQVEAAVSGVRFSLYQGYPTAALATAAFQLASEHGWTSEAEADSWSALPISISRAPSPINAQDSTAPTLIPRHPEDPWYVVYAGINPGIFPTFLECALNVLGIESSLHESVSTYDEAVAKFGRAKLRGEVQVRRTRRAQ